MSDPVSPVGALARDVRRFQRAASAAGRLHQSGGDGKCRECRKPSPCPTRLALNSGLDWDGREDPEPAEDEAAVQARRDKEHADGPCRCFEGKDGKREGRSRDRR